MNFKQQGLCIKISYQLRWCHISADKRNSGLKSWILIGAVRFQTNIRDYSEIKVNPFKL